MIDHRRAADMQARARQLLDRGSFGDQQVRRSATIAEPLLVVGPEREPHSWLVALTIAERLVAVFQFLLDGTVMRYSSYQRRPDDLTHCPLAREWLDADVASAHVRAKARPDEEVDDVWLTFDRNPDRVVWAVRLRGSGGDRTLFVAGTSIYEPPSSSASTFG